jgi:hypothetical protein
MKTLQFNTITGITEMGDSEWDDGTDFLGDFSGTKEDCEYVRKFFNEDFEGNRAIIVSDEIFEVLKEEYGIH